MHEPVAFAQALDEYLDSLSPEEVRTLVLRSIKRLDGAHRAQLGFFLGFDLSVHPIDEVAGGVDNRALIDAVTSCALLRERFGAFLRDNPRAIQALGKGPSERILGPEKRSLRKLVSPISMIAAALVGLITLFAFIPLGAQYAHQQGVLAGLSDVVLNPVRTLPVRIRAALPARKRTHVTVQHVAVRRAMRMHKVRVATLTARGPIAHVAARRPVAAPFTRLEDAGKQRIIVPHRRRVARAWKFDPRNNPYFGHARRQVARIPGPGRRAEPTRFEARSALVVTSYLHALIAGNKSEALAHLGLPSTASPSNLTESSIVSPHAAARVVNVDAQADGRTRVEVDITSRSGEYFETFYVARDGPAARITDRFYIPVNRTAEERAARLLAKDDR